MLTKICSKFKISTLIMGNASPFQDGGHHKDRIKDRFTILFSCVIFGDCTNNSSVFTSRITEFGCTSSTFGCLASLFDQAIYDYIKNSIGVWRCNRELIAEK